MSTKKRFERLAALKRREEQEHAKKVAASARQEDDAQSMLGRMNAYLQEYSSDWHARSTQPTSAAHLRSHWTFITRLQASVEQQHLHVRHAADLTYARSLDWRRARNETRRLDSLIERARDSEDERSRRRAQKDDDELAQLAHERRATNSVDDTAET